jgi:hypothetical protein
MGQLKRILSGRALLAAAVLLVSCGLTSNCFSQNPEGSGQIKFAISASGLPDEGIWKSAPAVSEIGGHPAVAVQSLHGKGAKVFLRSDSGQWTDSSQGLEVDGSCGGSVAFGDLNKDGCPDLVVADHCTGVSVYLGDCKGHWKQVAKGLHPAGGESTTTPEFFLGAEDVAIGDVNEDGCPDLVVGSADMGGLTVYTGDCSGTEWKETDAPGLPSVNHPDEVDGRNGGWATRVRLVDINKDGHLDIVASYFKGPRVWLGDGKGNWKSSSAGLPEPTLYGLYRGIAVGDVNGDGLPDIVAANSVNGVELYTQKPDGSWQMMPDVFPQMMGGANAVDLADMYKEGHLDLVVGGRLKNVQGGAWGLFLLKGNGKGEFKYDENTGLPVAGLSWAWDVKAVDVNGDGLLDIVASTGGVPTGKLPVPVENMIPESKKAAAKAKAAVNAAPPEIPESKLPRIQVWTQQSANK